MHPALRTAALLALLTSCSDPGTAGGVTLMISAGVAVHGGCGDAGPAVIPEAGVQKCGPDRDFSLTVTMQSEAGAPKNVKVVRVGVLSPTETKELTTTQVLAATSGGAPFDGTLAAGQRAVVRYELGQFEVTASQIVYQVTFSISGEALVVTSPTFSYSGPPQ